jgi:hypothetical protein
MSVKNHDGFVSNGVLLKTIVMSDLLPLQAYHMNQTDGDGYHVDGS